MSPVHARFGAATAKLRFSRLGAIGKPCRPSVVVTRKRRLPRARIPCCCMSRCTPCLPTRLPEHAVRARCAASRKLRDWLHTRHEYSPAETPRSGDDAERFAADEQGARGSPTHLPPAPGTAHGSATHADCVESRRASLLPLGKVRHSFSQDVALHRDPRQLGSQTADLHLLGGHLRTAVTTFQRAISMSLDPVEQRLLNQAQRARCSRYTLARLNKPNRFLFELERAPRPRRLNHRYPLR